MVFVVKSVSLKKHILKPLSKNGLGGRAEVTDGLLPFAPKWFPCFKQSGLTLFSCKAKLLDVT